ncbi:MAG: LacI family DNA-binding transcriptional regulator [Treponema sp.]|nr:LacI family DNA-binding transcriptional regulator [Treponema sp.]
MEKRVKVRLSDIADKLNISTVTVSKALANKDGVGDDLRKKIKALAEEMGYRTKRNSDSGAKITGNIGILIPSRFFAPSSSFYWYLFNNLSTELLQRSYYSIMELLSPEDEKNGILPHILQDGKVDGLIILGQVSNEYLDYLSAHYDDFILLDFYTNKVNLDCVADDNFYCSYMLTSYVISQGHKKLRFVGNFDSTTSIRDRYMGFAKALMENGIEVVKDEIISDRDSEGHAVPIELPLKDMPTAFICNCDETAALVEQTLIEKGYRVPEDVSVTGFDNYIAQNTCPVPLTTVSIRVEDTTSVAAELIINKITDQPYIRGRHLISGSIVLRDSVAPVK